MGNWYTNICVSGAKQSDVIAALNELGRHAYVTPETRGWIILYDRECDKFDLDQVESLALTISKQLSCTALGSFNADDDVLWLGVYENGKLATRYSSDRKQFEDAAEFPPIEEAAAVLCRIFAKPEKSAQVRNILPPASRHSRAARSFFSDPFRIFVRGPAPPRSRRGPRNSIRHYWLWF